MGHRYRSSERGVAFASNIQSVPRNVETFEPIEDDGQVNDETLKLADSALILLAELANVGQILLEGVGFEVIRDEETGSCAYVNVESGMRTNELPRLAMDTDEDWPLDVVCECVSLLAPSGVDERGEVLWQVKVVDFKLGEEDRQRGFSGGCSVGGGRRRNRGGYSGSRRPRALIRGSWRGSNGKVEGEVTRGGFLGCALDAWKRCDVCVGRTFGQRKETDISVFFCLFYFVVFVDDCFDFGLRDGSLPAFLARRYPSSELECVVVENDKRVVELRKNISSFPQSGLVWKLNASPPMNEYSSDAETRDFKCDVVLVSDGAQYPVEKYVNLEGLTLPVVAVANAKTLPHVNVLEPTWEGPNIVRCIDPQIEASAEEEEEEEEEEKQEKDASHAAKRRKQNRPEKEEENKNTAVVDAFFRRHAVKSTDVLLFIAVPNRSYARGIQNLGNYHSS